MGDFQTDFRDALTEPVMIPAAEKGGLLDGIDAVMGADGVVQMLRKPEAIEPTEPDWPSLAR